MLYSKFGFLRVSLLAVTFFNILISAVHWIGNDDFTVHLQDDASLWQIMAVYIAPVNAPILLVVVLFEYIMSKVRASDTEGEEKARFVLIYRVELLFIWLSLGYWIPYFVSLIE